MSEWVSGIVVVPDILSGHLGVWKTVGFIRFLRMAYF